MFDVDHCEAGAYLARDWGFSEELREAIVLHHAVPPPAGGGLPALVNLACRLADALGFRVRDTRGGVESRRAARRPPRDAQACLETGSRGPGRANGARGRGNPDLTVRGGGHAASPCAAPLPATARAARDRARRILSARRGDVRLCPRVRPVAGLNVTYSPCGHPADLGHCLGDNSGWQVDAGLVERVFQHPESDIPRAGLSPPRPDDASA